MKRTTKKSKINALISRAAEITAMLDEVKVLYRELDDITDELLEMEVLQAATSDHTMTIVDNFAEKNTQFRVARMKRFEIKIDRKAPRSTTLSKGKKDKWDFPIRKKPK